MIRQCLPGLHFLVPTVALAATDDKTNYIAAFIKANTSRKR